jgi:hypothetical protein
VPLISQLKPFLAGCPLYWAHSSLASLLDFTESCMSSQPWVTSLQQVHTYSLLQELKTSVVITRANDNSLKDFIGMNICLKIGRNIGFGKFGGGFTTPNCKTAKGVFCNYPLLKTEGDKKGDE